MAIQLHRERLLVTHPYETLDIYIESLYDFIRVADEITDAINKWIAEEGRSKQRSTFSLEESFYIRGANIDGVFRWDSQEINRIVIEFTIAGTRKISDSIALAQLTVLIQEYQRYTE